MTLPEYRCKNCGRLLCTGYVISEHLEIKCHSCKNLVRIGEDFGLFTRSQYEFVVEIISQGNGTYTETITSCTESAQKALDYTPAQIITYNLEKIDPLYAQGFNNTFWERYHENRSTSFSFETVHRRKDGELTCVHVTVRIAQELPTKLIAIYMCEVTETKNVSLDDAGYIITQNQDKDSFMDILCLNQKGICIGASNSFEKKLAVPPHSILFVAFSDLISTADEQKTKKAILDHAQRKVSFFQKNISIEIHGDGHKNFDVSFVAKYKDNGIFEGYTVSLTVAPPFHLRRSTDVKMVS